MKNFRLNVTTQSLLRENNYLFNYQDRNIITFHEKINNPCLIIKSIDNTINFIQKKNKILNYKEIYKKENIIGIILKNDNNEFIWNYNNYFIKNEFLVSFEKMDWIVVKNTFFSNQKNMHLLKEGDIIKLGNVVLLLRKIKILYPSFEKTISIKKNVLEINNNKNQNDSNNKINNQISFSKNINPENYKKKEIISSNKLNSIYIQSKKRKIKEKIFTCRICLLEGEFIGENPLINLCQCSGSVKYIHLLCAKKWFTSKTYKYISTDKNVISFTFPTFNCELCKTNISNNIKIGNEIISLLEIDNDFDKKSYISFETIQHYNHSDSHNNNFHIIYFVSFNNNNKITIGRCSTCDMVINDISVSRNHCNVFLDNENNLYIEDCISKFGTLLMIQNNFVFLPFKAIGLQLGKFHLFFYLSRSFFCCYKCNKNLNSNFNYDNQFNNQRKNVYSDILKDIIDYSDKNNDDDNNSNNNDDRSIVSSTIKMLDITQRDNERNELEKFDLNKTLTNPKIIMKKNFKRNFDIDNSSKENFIIQKEDLESLFKTKIEMKKVFKTSSIKKNNFIQKNNTFNELNKYNKNKKSKYN